ncbi:sigma-70 family RNA polymerase sigma factor, partial [Selenomonadales bacterium OttesenSCG-928-I06]|nr:sigma-70 family RNA polymerase sigma factor [Selenomonadales bacterium OttesenSCG-928-I06]
MLNDNDIKALLLKAQSEDIKIKKHAINELTENNLNLVRSIVQRFQNRGYEFEDLFQIGCIGLVKAIERFDLNRDLRFSTYAVPLIIGEIRRFLRDDGAIKVSRSLKELGFKIAQVREQFQKDFSRDPTINEIADLLNISQE